MKRLVNLVFILSIVLNSSCLRRHHCASHLRVKTVYNALQGYTSTYYYNSDGNLVAVTRSNGSKTVIEYADKWVSGKTTDKDGHLASTWFCLLNGRGLVDSMVKKDSTRITSTKKFTYDKQAFAIEEREYIPGQPLTITRKYISDGNIISFTVMLAEPYPAKVTFNAKTGKNDTVSITATGNEYTVYNDYMMDKEKTLSFGNYGSAEFGEGTRNVEKRTVQISPEGDTIDVSTFKYAFDKQGRVTLSVTRNQAGDLLDSNYIAYY